MLQSALIYLVAAVIAVPVAKRLGLGSVLGYLIAGVIIGPYVFRLVGEQKEVMHFAEFGVVMMLFLIGLELKPSRLWELRRPIIGLGGLQVAITTALASLIVFFFSDIHFRTAIAIGLAIALSSTAIVLQSLEERNLLRTHAGQNALSVLLFQDVAVIPILAFLPLLATGAPSLAPDAELGDHHGSMIVNLPAYLQVGISIAIIAGIIIGGKFLASPIFRFIANTNLREIFTAFALLIVVANAALMSAIGLSPALGTFLAGVVLAECEFRHELEVDIEPFKGLLLGLFFITVGASIDFNVLMQNPLLICLSAVGLILLKFSILIGLSRFFGMRWKQGMLLGLALAQGGEFAFVIVTAGKQVNVFEPGLANIITVVVAFSMMVSPLLLVFYEKYFGRTTQNTSTQSDEIKPTGEVIIAGYGRFGQIIGRLLQAQGHHLTILDHSPGQVEVVKGFGNTVYYGDAARRDLLEAAGAKDAKLLVIAVDDTEKCLEIIETAKRYYPHLKLIARAIDRRHAYQLMEKKVDALRRETFDSALYLGVDALKLLGVSEEDAKHAGALFSEHDHESLEKLSELWGDNKSYGRAIRQRLEDLKSVLENDKKKRDARNG